MSYTCDCGASGLTDVTTAWRDDTDADAVPSYVGGTDYSLARALECPEFGAVHGRYREVR